MWDILEAATAAPGGISGLHGRALTRGTVMTNPTQLTHIRVGVVAQAFVVGFVTVTTAVCIAALSLVLP